MASFEAGAFRALAVVLAALVVLACVGTPGRARGASRLTRYGDVDAAALRTVIREDLRACGYEVAEGPAPFACRSDTEAFDVLPVALDRRLDGSDVIEARTSYGYERPLVIITNRGVTRHARRIARIDRVRLVDSHDLALFGGDGDATALGVSGFVGQVRLGLMAIPRALSTRRS